MRVILYLIIFLLLSCGKGNENAGATTETTNGIQISILDSLGSPKANARLNLYASNSFVKLDSAWSDSLGQVTLPKWSRNSKIHFEAISGTDSSLMAWQASSYDSMQKMVLRPSAYVRLRTAVPIQDTAELPISIQLANTPYLGYRKGAEYVFSRIPSGVYILQTSNDNILGTLYLQPNSILDTLWGFDVLSQALLFDDFEDGDVLTIPAIANGSQGWYLNQEKGASWIIPSSTTDLATAIHVDAVTSHRFLGLQFQLGDTGTVVLGTHLGKDAERFDLSNLTAIRITIRGNSRFDFALETPYQPITGEYQKTLWTDSATSEWKDVIFRPGDEFIDSINHQLSFQNNADSIALMSFFIRSGSYLEIDAIVLEGLSSTDLE